MNALLEVFDNGFLAASYNIRVQSIRMHHMWLFVDAMNNVMVTFGKGFNQKSYEYVKHL